jgi:ubiquinone/menaquinone biosynthesis C-methylase UbiE
MDMFTSYDFGYSWPITYGHLVPLTAAVAVAALAAWCRWPRLVTVLAGLVGLWSLAGFLVVQLLFGLTSPMAMPTDRFLASGAGRVLDAGAGSGRAGVGVLIARPKATVTALDIYSGYWGIDDNTPERFMANAHAAGAGDRAAARTGDVREMPFGDAEFDAVISSYAIDHLSRQGTVKAMAEVHRVLRPGGEFLLMIVNSADWLLRLMAPPLAHHPRQNPSRWRQLIEDAGLTLEEDGTTTGTFYFYAVKK